MTAIFPNPMSPRHSVHRRPDSWIVVPCYNEAQRLPAQTFRDFAAFHPEIGFCFVNDGSQDQTGLLLADLASTLGEQGMWLDLPRNGGKAEAVRRGMQATMAWGAYYAGYWDADLATPLEAINDFRAKLQARNEVRLVMGVRLPLAGHAVNRLPLRRFQSRLFSIATSATLGRNLVDSQCGAKLFRIDAITRGVFGSPFLSRWIFDVEILARLTELEPPATSPTPHRIYELPLDQWDEIPGSKLTTRAAVRAAMQLAQIAFHYRRHRWQSTDDQDQLENVATWHRPMTQLSGLLQAA